MTQTHWSPGDLSRQRRVVRRIALRAELNRRRLGAARRSFVAGIRRTLGTPLGLSSSFVAGIVAGRQPRHGKPREAGAQRGRSHLRAFATTVFWLAQFYSQVRDPARPAEPITPR